MYIYMNIYIGMNLNLLCDITQLFSVFENVFYS